MHHSHRHPKPSDILGSCASPSRYDWTFSIRLLAWTTWYLVFPCSHTVPKRWCNLFMLQTVHSTEICTDPLSFFPCWTLMWVSSIERCYEWAPFFNDDKRCQAIPNFAVFIISQDLAPHVLLAQVLLLQLIAPYPPAITTTKKNSKSIRKEGRKEGREKATKEVRK